MVPTRQAVAGGAANVTKIKAVTGSEDFSFYQEKVSGVYLFLGGMRKGTDPATTADHHKAGFVLNKSGFTLMLSQKSFSNKKAGWSLPLDGKTNRIIHPVVG